MNDRERWDRTIAALQADNRIGSIDWRSEPDELQEALEPLLARHGATLDWSFVAALEAADDWEAIKNENLLPRVAAEIGKQGLILAHINEANDAYSFAVCTPDEFAAIDGVSDPERWCSIGRFKAPGKR